MENVTEVETHILSFVFTMYSFSTKKKKIYEVIREVCEKMKIEYSFFEKRIDEVLSIDQRKDSEIKLSPEQIEMLFNKENLSCIQGDDF